MNKDLILPLVDKKPTMLNYVDNYFDGELYDINYRDMLPYDFSYPYLACIYFLNDFAILIADSINE